MVFDLASHEEGANERGHAWGCGHFSGEVVISGKEWFGYALETATGELVPSTGVSTHNLANAFWTTLLLKV